MTMMVLVDTSVWINHFRKNDRHLAKLLSNAQVLCHPHVIGELACGNLNNRQEILSLLRELPQTPVIDFEEFMFFIEQNQLQGKGIGFVDVHLLASAKLGQVPLWTTDRRLKTVSMELSLAYKK